MVCYTHFKFNDNAVIMKVLLNDMACFLTATTI
jgi:hypothetical protein